MRSARVIGIVLLVVGGVLFAGPPLQAQSPGNVRIVSADGSRAVGVTSSNELRVSAAITPTGTQDVNLIRVGGATVALGQTTRSASIPVTLASDQPAVAVLEGAPTTFGSAQLAVTATAQPLATNAARAVCVKNTSGSTRSVYLGDAAVATSSGDELEPGERLCLTIDNTNRIYVRAADVGATVSYSWVN